MAKKNDDFFFQNFVECAEFSLQAAKMLKDSLIHFNPASVKDLIEPLHNVEHAADMKKHEMKAALVKAFITPIEREDIMMLSQDIDDVTDCIEDVLLRIYINNVRTIREDAIPFAIGDTVQISESRMNGGLYTIWAIDDTTFTVSEDIKDEDAVLITKIAYPADVVDCCLNLLEWSKNYGGKVGIKSETLSRHSVTYEDSATLFMGFPVGILKGLKSLYNKVRF